MFQLAVESEGLQGGSFPVRCCLDAESLAAIDLAIYPRVYVLLSVVPNGKAERRYGQRFFFPLDQLVQYVAVSVPGSHQIFGWVVPLKDKEAVTDWLKALMRSRDDVYSMNLLDLASEPQEILSFQDVPLYTLAQAALEVVVPARGFASEPPAWINWWANRWFSSRPANQCQFRGRCFFAFTLQLPILLVTLALSLLGLLVTLILGFWWLDWISLKEWAKPADLFDLWVCSDATDNGYRFAWNWLRRLGAEPSPAEIEHQKVEELARLKARYQSASCELAQTSPRKLVTSTRRVYLSYNELKRKVCKPFAR